MKESCQFRIARGILPAFFLCSAATALAQTPSVPPKAAHGAFPMEVQQASISAWLGEKIPVRTPAGVAPAFWASLAPSDNHATDARIALGRKLYFDPALSSDGTVACATCHDTGRGFTDQRGTSEGVGNRLGRRNAPTVLNAAFFSSQFWDGRAASLEEQAKLPIVNPIEMGLANGAAAVAALAKNPSYAAEFMAAYGRPINYDDIGRAIAAFERTLIFVESPFDKFAGGEVQAISAEAKAGWALFNGKARCVSCHQMSSSNPIGTDNRFHNIGVSAREANFESLAKRGLEALTKDGSAASIDRMALETDLSSLGRFVVSRNRSDIGAFKTSQVRNVGITGPYMHDGSMTTLWDVVDHYNKGGEPNSFLDAGIEPLNLTEKEVDELVAFLFSLTDVRFTKQNQSELVRQKQIASQQRPFRDQDLTSRKVLPFERRVTGGK